ncbi:hypothetical protein Q4519_17355 [Motilimonas sp. 1_MG-2023]|uniref:hypothetical protein n=1 Tax=Motilimonas sp. 1_MG-2023 TaxID=3062672 RepID=UPI0026E223E7|nr:hypothetical protein [Motilimonas sp. 1_MG-2023]MDO6527450.1 hypothetical protein [Motilimonas sp. 1_MG-2023]
MISSVQEIVSIDVEYGNSESFYSASRNNHNVDIANLPVTEKKWNGTLVKTSIELFDSYIDIQSGIKRRLNFTAKDDSLLFDMVSRFVIETECDEPAMIAGQLISHKSSNIYYQFPENEVVEIPLTNNRKVVISTEPTSVPNGFDAVIYLRDEKRIGNTVRWIVHHRLIANKNKANLIMRCCNPRMEGVIKGQKFIPKFIKSLFYRIREAHFPNFPVMSVGEVLLPKGGAVSLITKVVIK